MQTITHLELAEILSDIRNHVRYGGEQGATTAQMCLDELTAQLLSTEPGYAKRVKGN